MWCWGRCTKSVGLGQRTVNLSSSTDERCRSWHLGCGGSGFCHVPRYRCLCRADKGDLGWRRFALDDRRAWHEQDYQCPEQGGYCERVEVPLKPELGSRGSYDVPPVQRAKDGTQPPESQRPAECGRPTVRRVVPGGVCVDDYSRSYGPD